MKKINLIKPGGRKSIRNLDSTKKAPASKVLTSHGTMADTRLTRAEPRRTKPILRKSLTTGQLRTSTADFSGRPTLLPGEHYHPQPLDYGPVNPLYADHARASQFPAVHPSVLLGVDQSRRQSQIPSEMSHWTNQTRETLERTRSSHDDSRPETSPKSRSSTKYKIICLAVVFSLIFVAIFLGLYFTILKRQCWLKFQDHQHCRGFNGVLMGAN